MAIRLTNDIVAKAGRCKCGGEVDCFRQDNGKWYAQCQKCLNTGRTAVDWKRALARFRQGKEK